MMKKQLAFTDMKIIKIECQRIQRAGIGCVNCHMYNGTACEVSGHPDSWNFNSIRHRVRKIIIDNVSRGSLARHRKRGKYKKQTEDNND